MKNYGLSMSIFVTMTLLALSSCVNSELIEPEIIGEQENNQLVINISAPVETKTRAHDGYYLRYVAKLFPLYNGSSLDSKNMRRKEILEDGFEENKIVFDSVDPNVKYRIMVFADYIPSNTLNSKNGYNDYHYNTSSSNETVYMITNPESPSSNTLSPEFFNNDNYDCFSMSDTIHKTSKRREVNYVLKRAVAKVKWIDTSSAPGSLDYVSFSAFRIFNSFNQTTSTRLSSLTLPNFTIHSYELPKNDAEAVFYFYTFASPNSEKINVGFSTKADEIETPWVIKQTEIPVRQNYITNVKGVLLPQSTTGDDPGNGDTVTSEDDMLILNVSTDQDWEKEVVEQPI